MTFTLEDIAKDEYVSEFISSSPLKDATAKNYILHLKNYANFLDKNPTDLLLEAEKEQDEGRKSRRRSVKKYLNNFARHLESENYSPLTVERTICTVKCFYGFFDIEMPRIKTEPHIPTTIKDLPTLVEVGKVVRSATTRDKALILLHLSSGLSMNEIRNLKYSDFLEAVNLPKNTPISMIRTNLEKNTIPQIVIGREKVHMYEYTTFASPESCTAIIDYLEEREDESEWLFTNGDGNQLAKRTYQAIFERLNDRNKLGFKRNKKARRFSSHQLRRVFASNMLSKHVAKESIDFMLGHRASSVTEAYFKANSDSLKEDYIKGLDSITLNKINIVNFESAEVQEMKQQMKEMKQKMEYQEKELSLHRKIMNQLGKVDKL